MSVVDRLKGRTRATVGAALVGTGLLAGAILGTTLTAGASTNSTNPATTATSSTGSGGTSGSSSSSSPNPGGANAPAPPGGYHGLPNSGTVTAVGSDSVSIGGKAYAVTSSSDIDKNGEASLSSLAVGDAVTFSTVQSASTPTIDKLHAGNEALDRPSGPPPAGAPGYPSGGGGSSSSSTSLG